MAHAQLPPCRILHHTLVDSTNERALAAIEAGSAQHFDVHVARGQTAGRGRRGSAWVSAEGQGLYASLILLPESPAPVSPAVTMLAGLALFDAVHDLGLPQARLKWPNDVVIAGRKLAGVLVESRGFQAERPHFVIGVGLNVSQQEFPAELTRQRPVTSLAMEDIQAGVPEALECLLRALPRRWEQVLLRPAEQAGDFLAAAELTGTVQVEGPQGAQVGRIAAFDARSGLRLALEGGGEARFALEHVRAVARA